MSTANTLLNIEGAFKEIFAKNWGDLTLKNRPLSGMVDRMETFGGIDIKVPCLTTSGAQVSPSFAVAQAGASRVSLGVSAFAVTRQSLYTDVIIDNQTLLASQSNEGAFFDVSVQALQQAINKASNYLELYMFGDGSGVLGQMANTTVSTSVIQLKSAASALNFEKGDELDLSSTLTGTGSLRVYGSNSHGLYVGAINEDLGQITVVDASGNAVNINDSADGVVTPGTTDYLFAKGSKGKVLAGLGAWLPSTAPVAGSDSFFGVDRGQHPNKLAGLRSDETTSGKSIKEMLIDGHMKVAARDGSSDVAFMAFATFGALCKELEATAYRPEHGPGQISYPSVEVMTNNGVIKVVPANRCSTSDIFMLDMDTITLGSIGPAIRGLDTKDGLDWLRSPSDDSVESRIGSYSNLWVSEPYKNLHISIPSQG